MITLPRRLGRWVPVLSLSMIAGCVVNPATGGRMLSFVSESQEIEMGRSYSRQIEATTQMYDDAVLQAYVEGIGLRLAAR